MHNKALDSIYHRSGCGLPADVKCARVSVWQYICIYIYTNIYSCIYIYAWWGSRINQPLFKIGSYSCCNVCVCECVRLHIHVCIHINTHILMYMYIHTWRGALYSIDHCLDRLGWPLTVALTCVMCVWESVYMRIYMHAYIHTFTWVCQIAISLGWLGTMGVVHECDMTHTYTHPLMPWVSCLHQKFLRRDFLMHNTRTHPRTNMTWPSLTHTHLINTLGHYCCFMSDWDMNHSCTRHQLSHEWHRTPHTHTLIHTHTHSSTHTQTHCHLACIFCFKVTETWLVEAWDMTHAPAWHNLLTSSIYPLELSFSVSLSLPLSLPHALFLACARALSLSLFIHVCIYVEVCICIYIYIFIYIYVCMYTYIHTYTHACLLTYTHTYTREYIHTYIHIYIHTYIHIYIHLCVHAFFIYIHTYIHTYIQRGVYSSRTNTQHCFGAHTGRYSGRGHYPPKSRFDFASGAWAWIARYTF